MVRFNLSDLQATEEEHEDKKSLLQAINAMTDVAHAINEYKRRKDLGKTRLVMYKQVQAKEGSWEGSSADQYFRWF